MNIFTLKGRIQTKLLTYILLALITGVFVMVTGQQIWPLFMMALLVGLVLEAIWGVFITYQPGWMTILFGIVEFIGIAVGANLIGITTSLGVAAIYYVISWSLIQLFLIYLLPVLHLGWSDYGGEIW